MKRGGIILCGGKSVRMGVDKAMLPFGPETMLKRMVRLVGQVVGTENLIVVASRGQLLPTLPAEVSIAYDQNEDLGPLEALRCGLSDRDDLDIAYVSGCDTPLLVPAWIERLFALASEDSLKILDIVVPRQAEYYFPLAAVYRRSVLPIIESQLAAKEYALKHLFKHCEILPVEVELLREIDPNLQSLQNINRPDDYQQILSQAGFLSAIEKEDE